MPFKRTKEGWASSQQIRRQAKAWEKARASLMDMLGAAVDDESLLAGKAEKIFKDMDTDGNGSIDHGELIAAFNMMGVKLKNKEALNMISEADADGDGEIDAEEWLALLKEEVKRWKQNAKMSSMCSVM